MIVFCHLLNDHSGSPTILRATLRALGEQFDGALYVGSQGPGVLDDANVPTHRYWYRRGRYRLVTLLTYFVSQIMLYRALARARDIPADAIVFVNTLLPFAAMLWGWRTGRRVIVHVHEVSLSPRLLQSFLVWIASKTVDMAIYVSKDNCSRLPINGVIRKTIPNSIPHKLARVGASTSYEPMRTGIYEVLMLASPRDYKGIPEFFSLADRFVDRSDVMFSLVLNGGIKEIEKYLSRFRIPANVRVFPRTAEPERFYSRADLLLNLSRVDQWIETFGLTIVEAMAFGIPVIAPPIGGPTEIVTDGNDGFLIDSRDLDALEMQVRTLIDNSDLTIAISKAARSRSQDYTFEQFSIQLREALSKLPPTTE